MRANWAFIATLSLFIPSCLPPLDETSINPVMMLQGLLSSPDTTPTTSGYSVGGTIHGDTPTGLQLDFTGTDCAGAQTKTPTATGAYSFSGLPDGCSAADITITTQPSSSYCNIYNNTGRSIASANVTDVDVYCFSVQFQAGPHTVYEGTPKTIRVRLSASPGPTAVAISFTSSDSTVTTTSTLNFAETDFNTYQNITLTNPIDFNRTVEHAVITATTDGKSIGSVAANTFDSTSGSADRYIYATSGTHTGDFANDVSLEGSNWMQKADSYCSDSSNMPVALQGTGNYRAILVDNVLRRSQPAQINWPIRSGVTYYNYDLTKVQTAGPANLFPFPVTNPLTDGGSYWTGVTIFLGEWRTVFHCSQWGDGTGAQKAHFGDGTSTTESLVFGGAAVTATCNTPKSLLCVQDLRDRGDGTVSSAHMNLLWQKCEAGQSWDGSCMGAVTPMVFCNSAANTCNGGTPTGLLDGSGSSQIYTYCNSLSLGGRSWRVPTLDELRALYVARRPTSAALFPGLNATALYYSKQSANDDEAWTLNLSAGTETKIAKGNPARVRCVSDGL